MADFKLTPDQQSFVENLINNEASGSLQDRCASFAESLLDDPQLKAAKENILANRPRPDDISVLAEAWRKHRLSLKKELQNHPKVIEGNAHILSFINQVEQEQGNESDSEGDIQCVNEINDLIAFRINVLDDLKRLQAILSLKKHEFNLYRHLLRYQDRLEKVRPQFNSPTKSAVTSVLKALVAPKTTMSFNTKTARFVQSSALTLNIESAIVGSKLRRILNASAIFGKEKNLAHYQHMESEFIKLNQSEQSELVYRLNTNTLKDNEHLLKKIQDYMVNIFQPENILKVLHQQIIGKVLINYVDQEIEIFQIPLQNLLDLSPLRYKLCIQLMAFIHQPQAGKAQPSFLTQLSSPKEIINKNIMKDFTQALLTSLANNQALDHVHQGTLNQIMREKICPLYEVIHASRIIRQPSLVEMICPRQGISPN